MSTVTLSSAVAATLCVWIGAVVQIAGATAPPVDTCDSITRAKPGVGVAYKGIVRNDDYGVQIVIPDGLTGWGGVAPEAPFHGFVIFLPDRIQSCAGFEIRLRVDPGDGARAHRDNAGKAAMVGNVAGPQDIRSGFVDGIAFTNVAISFSVPQRGEVFDGSVWLVTPTKDLARNMPIFRSFVSHIRFDGRRAR